MLLTEFQFQSNSGSCFPTAPSFWSILLISSSTYQNSSGGCADDCFHLGPGQECVAGSDGLSACTDSGFSGRCERWVKFVFQFPENNACKPSCLLPSVVSKAIQSQKHTTRPLVANFPSGRKEIRICAFNLSQN